jgi:CheY-like chemotaxis protein
MAEQKKAVLMIHTDQEQGQLWQTALETQQLVVTWAKDTLNLVQYLETCNHQDLPDLLLMDMALKSPNSETLQSSSVCQWVNKQQVPVKVVLFNPRQERIKDVEHSWALRRGASDVLPRLSRKTLLTEVARVTALIGCSLISQPLEKIASGLAPIAGATKIQERVLTAVPDIEMINVNLKTESKSNPKTEVKSDPAVMYRGVRIRR